MAADAIGSVRAEGLEPGQLVIEILDRWANGLIETDRLGEAAERLAAGDLATPSLLAATQLAPTPR